jgi:coenzyme F420-dependent glucose-6-phosphate dehydrogenase
VLKLGYKASAEQFGPTELLQFSRLAEQSGFDSVFISDHFQPWKHHGGHAPFSLAWLGALGALTSRITIGTSVMTPTFRYHPAVVAQAFATLGVMFPDRIVLGVGTGELERLAAGLSAERAASRWIDVVADALDMLVRIG